MYIARRTVEDMSVRLLSGSVATILRSTVLARPLVDHDLSIFPFPGILEEWTMYIW